MLRCDGLDGEAVDLGEGIAEDVPARHVVLMEEPDALEVGLVPGDQGRLGLHAADEVAGKELAAPGIETAEGTWEVGIGGENELDLAVVQRQSPAVLVHQPEGHAQAVVLEQGLGPRMGHKRGVPAVDRLVDQGHRGGDVRVRVVADVVADLVEGYDLLDLAQGAGEG